MPITTPITSVKLTDSTAISAVSPTRLQMSSETGWLLMKDQPKSPRRTMPPIQRMYR